MTAGPIGRPVASSQAPRSPRSGPTKAAKGRTTVAVHRPVEPQTRYVTAAVVRDLDDRLSERDRAVLGSLRQLRVLTGNQLERLHFQGLTDRQRRRTLAQLEADGLVARLSRRIGGVRSGSAGSVFALDRAGQRLLGATGPARGGRIERPWTPGPPFLAHTLSIAELYVRLVEAHRAEHLELLGFQAEPACWRRFQSQAGWTTCKPDAALRLGAGVYEDHWLIEVDRGTESPQTIARKAAVYRAYRSTGREQAGSGIFPKVLWLVPDQPRADLLIDVFGSGPADAWRLHTAVPFAAAITRLAAGAGEAAS